MVFSLNELDGWKKDWALMDRFFTPEERRRIEEKLTGFQPAIVACCSMENRFAPSGGLAAVISNSPAFLNDLPGLEAFLLTPFHAKIIPPDTLRDREQSVEVQWRGRTVAVRLFDYRAKVEVGRRTLEVTEHYLKADGFWEAENGIDDPYLYRGDAAENDPRIRRDALFFCKAVPLVAKALGVTRNVVFHLHEWQAALLSLTVKDAMLEGTLESAGAVQTMHNPFDSEISTAELAEILTNHRARERVAERGAAGEDDGKTTAYTIGLSLVDAPTAVVSEHFAREFRTDILHTQHYAPHLQRRFDKSLIGINNGPFVPQAGEFPNGADHSVDELRQIKEERRRELLQVLASYHPAESFGGLSFRGGGITGLPVDVPILVMTGRLDTCQKGYDVLLAALEKFQPGEVKTVLAPMPLKDSDLDCFRETARQCDGDLAVFPIRMAEGYRELQSGATFAVWPSIYEPFGGAIEYMANGTFVVARETGGLVDQVDRGKDGLLYRESSAHYTRENIEDYFLEKDRVRERRNNPWFAEMADALHDALREAIELYQQEPDRYYGMILNGFSKARQFGWLKNSNEHRRLYDQIGKV